jgi:hypothetical protein
MMDISSNLHCIDCNLVWNLSLLGDSRLTPGESGPTFPGTPSFREVAIPPRLLSAGTESAGGWSRPWIDTCAIPLETQLYSFERHEDGFFATLRMTKAQSFRASACAWQKAEHAPSGEESVLMPFAFAALSGVSRACSGFLPKLRGNVCNQSGRRVSGTRPRSMRA